MNSERLFLLICVVLPNTAFPIQIKNFESLFVSTFKKGDLLPKDLLPKDLVGFEIPQFQENIRDGIVTFILNGLVDLAFKKIQNYILLENGGTINVGYSSMKLIPKGKMEFLEGVFSDLETFSRNGDTIVSFNSTSKQITLGIPVRIHDFKFQYRFNAEVMKIFTGRGRFKGIIKNLDLRLDLIIDLEDNIKLVSNELNFVHSGFFKLVFMDNKMIDWYSNVVVKSSSLLYNSFKLIFGPRGM
ncbi:hypothetical protein JTB14_021772 [Gonioctena quinquepunctata]|nr:hypothetical protein JTB14_021772 [Gonioctena quinquepunctata]